MISGLPDSMKILYCNNNHITFLPDKMPDYLCDLDCSSNNITILPDIFPDTLEMLYCQNNKIKKIPSLTNCDKLHYFDYSNNQIE